MGKIVDWDQGDRLVLFIKELIELEQDVNNNAINIYFFLFII